MFIQYLALFLLASAGGAVLLISARIRADGHTPAEWAAYGMLYFAIALWFLGKALQPLNSYGRRLLLEQARFMAWVRYCGDKGATLMIACLLVLAWLAQALIDETLSPTVESPSVVWLGLERVAVLRGEFWRIPASAFLHGGVIHLFVNVFTLCIFGAWCESVLGTRYLLLSLFAGLASGALGSLVFYSGVPTIGFSGAIGGVLGLLFTVILCVRNVFPATSGVQLILFVAVWFAFGKIATGVDNAMHLSGFVGGIFVALIMVRSRRTELHFRLVS